MNEIAKCKNCTDEMIEEMAKLDIEESAGFYSVFINDMRISKNKPLSTSKTVMSFDCPKKYILQAIGIPEGSVVVDKEYLKKELQGLEAQTRKETAKEILKEIMSVETEEEKWLKNEPFVRYVKKMLDKIQELAKQFGVGMEE